MRFFKDLVRAILAAVVLILAVEGGLRLAGERFDAHLYQHELERGFSPRPNAHGWALSEGNVYVRINSDGMRDRERAVPLPLDTLRIAVLGSSIAEGTAVPLDQTFEAEMQRRLGARFAERGGPVDVLNFGVTAYTQSQEYLTLRNHVWKYKPQIVVLLWDQFVVLKNTRETNPDEGGGSRARNWPVEVPYYALQNGSLELIPPATTKRPFLLPRTPGQIAVENSVFDMMNNSYLLALLNQALLKLGSQALNFVSVARRGLSERATPSRQSLDDAAWMPYAPYVPQLREDWAVGEALIAAMKSECDRHGAELLVVTADSAMASNPDLAARNAFLRRYGLPSLDESGRRMEEFCHARNIPVLRLGPPMGEYAATHGVPLYASYLHWNRLGHELAGRLIAEDLQAHSLAVQAPETGAASSPNGNTRHGMVLH